MHALIALFQENSPLSGLMALVTGLLCFFVLSWVIKWLVRKIHHFAEKTSNYWDDVIANAISATHPATLAYLSLYACLSSLTLRPGLERLLDRGLIIAIVIQVGFWASRAISSWMEQRSTAVAANGDNSSLSSLGVFKVIAQIVLWITIFLLLLDNLGFNISALVTSLGIGGVAIALAVQNILGDLFASLSIAMDKPFVVGDFIVVDEHMGTVKHIGLKTTRVQSLSGEELVFSNADLLRSRVRNYKRMSERRITFEFGITYNTAADQIERVNAIVKHAIEAQEQTRFDRVHFKQFGDSSLGFEAVYYILDQDFLRYMNAQQGINLVMLQEFSAAGIEFAFPTQSIHVASLPSLPRRAQVIAAAGSENG